MLGYEAVRKGGMFGKDMYSTIGITSIVISIGVSAIFVWNLTEAEKANFPLKRALIVYGCLVSYITLCCTGFFTAIKSTKKAVNKRDQHSGVFFTRRPLIYGSLISCLLIFVVIFNDVNKIVKASFITDVYTGWDTLMLSITVSSVIFAYSNANAVVAQRKRQIYQFPSVIIDSLLISTVIYFAAAICTYWHTGTWSVTNAVVIACGVLGVVISGAGTAGLLFMLTWKNA